LVTERTKLTKQPLKKAIQRLKTPCAIHCPHDPAFDETVPLVRLIFKIECGNFAAPLSNEKLLRKQVAAEDVAD
jgi:hypothetical protein